LALKNAPTYPANASWKNTSRTLPRGDTAHRIENSAASEKSVTGPARLSVIALDGADAGPAPIALVADTVNVYVVPLVRPVTVVVVAGGAPVTVTGVCAAAPTNGVTVRACYGTSDADPNLINCTTSKVVTLTVTSEPLGVTIGTNETIVVNDLTYVKKFVISVSDSAGVAKPDVNLVVSVDLPTYRKGFYAAGATKWVKGGGLPSGDTAICANEDTNRNGVLENGEDVNNDGQLWPRKPDVIVSLQTSKTGADGTAVMQIEYAKDHGTWVDALITVSASGVSGTEGRATYLVAPVPVDAASISNVAASPAYIVSPYGTSNSCANPH